MFRPKSVVQCPSNATVISSLRGCFPRSAGKDVITRLLDKKESTRLGSKSGASEVKQHKWFAKINWGLLRNTQPPVRVSPRLMRMLALSLSWRGASCPVRPWDLVPCFSPSPLRRRGFCCFSSVSITHWQPLCALSAHTLYSPICGLSRRWPVGIAGVVAHERRCRPASF